MNNQEEELNNLREKLKRVSDLADKYAEKAYETNPNGYGGLPLDKDNSISYWLVSRELWKVLSDN